MNAQNLKNAMNLILGATRSDILIQRTENVVYVAGENLLHNAVFSFKDAGDDLTVIIPKDTAKDLTKQIRKSDTISMEIGDNATTFVLGNGNKFTYATLDPFALSLKRLLFHFNKNFSATLSASIFSNAITKIFSFAPKEMGDKRFKGAHVQTKDNSLEFMSTDNQAMAVMRVPMLDNKAPIKNILPKDFEQVTKLFLDVVELGSNKDNFWFRSTSDDGKFTSMVVMKTFYVDDDATPLLDYEGRVIGPFTTEADKVKFTVNKAELLEVIEDISPYADKILQGADFTVTTNKLTASASLETGSGNVSTDAVTYSGPELNLRVSLFTLRKVLNAFGGDSIEFEKGTGRAKVVTPDLLSVYISLYIS